MKRKRVVLVAVVLLALSVLVVACQPQTVEVTRVVQETVTEVEQVEVTRVVTETIEVEGEQVEVTRIVEVATESEEDFPEGTELRFLMWSHFVPNHDTWFDQYAVEWGEANGVDVTVDHVNIADVAPSLSAAIDAGEGPTIVELSLGAAQFIEGIHDLTDINMRAQELFGEPAETCVANSYLPTTDTWYGYCHGWTPDPGDYDISLWSDVGMPDGPQTWDDLLVGGSQIFEQTGIPLGLGLSPEIDSNMAMRAIIWSFGGSIQDENECVTINSPEVVEAVEYLVELYNSAMTEEVFSWDAAANNQGLIAGELSYILNSISAYRSLQKIDPAAADNIGFTPALSGPRGDQHASAHLWYIYVIPDYVERDSPEYRAAEEFIIYHTANYNQVVFNSELYNFPTFESTVPQLEGWLEVDPFGSRPPDKLSLLATADEWVTYLGYPGPSNPAVSEVYATNIIPTMMGRAALGEVTPEEAVAEAEAQINEIFQTWRDRGFVGCTDQ